jgi:hypothetical protein
VRETYKKKYDSTHKIPKNINKSVVIVSRSVVALRQTGRSRTERNRRNGLQKGQRKLWE